MIELRWIPRFWWGWFFVPLVWTIAGVYHGMAWTLFFLMKAGDVIILPFEKD